MTAKFTPGFGKINIAGYDVSIQGFKKAQNGIVINRERKTLGVS